MAFCGRIALHLWVPWLAFFLGELSPGLGPRTNLGLFYGSTYKKLSPELGYVDEKELDTQPHPARGLAFTNVARLYLKKDIINTAQDS